LFLMFVFIVRVFYIFIIQFLFSKVSKKKRLIDKNLKKVNKK